jgi:hypothetical protein
MYLLFRYHGIKPPEYKAMKYGEKRIIEQFMYQEIEELNKEYQGLRGDTDV